jgi:hypothetical protein
MAHEHIQEAEGEKAVRGDLLDLTCRSAIGSWLYIKDEERLRSAQPRRAGRPFHPKQRWPH